MTSSSPTSASGKDDDADHSGDTVSTSGQQEQQKKQSRLSFGISQILQSDDHRRRTSGRHVSDVINSNGGGSDSTMALIRSAFGSYVSSSAGVQLPGLLVGGAASAADEGLYGGTSGVIRVPAQRLSVGVGVCVGQQTPGTAAAACRLSAMMFPWMRERKDGLTCKCV